MISWLLAAVLNVGTLKYALGFLKQKSKILSALLKGRQCWFSSSWLHFCILDVTCFVWCFKSENQKDRRLIGFFLGGGKKSLLLYTTPKHSSVLPLGYPYSRQGSGPLWTPDLLLFMFWAHLNLISRAQRCLFHTSLRDSLTAVTCAASAHYGLHCQKGGDSLAILKWWQTLASLFKDGSCSSTHTEGEPALCSFDLVLQTSFPGLRLPTRPGQPSHSNCFSCGIYE